MNIGFKRALMTVALSGALSADAEICVDAKIPAGNIVCERMAGDQVYLHQEQRGSTQWWFYWAFRVCGAEGRTLTFHFTDGEPVGTRGPAVSADKGVTWRWLNKDFTKKSFTYAFTSAESEVWLTFGMVYTERAWERFLQRYAGSLFLQSGPLATTRKGRSVQKLRAGCITAEPRYRVLLTARHHACEMMASYVVEGVLEGVLAEDETGRWLREHVETEAIRTQVPEWACGKLTVALDFHCPWIRGEHNEWVYQVGSSSTNLWAQQQALGTLLEKVLPNSLGYRQANDLPYGKAWNSAANFSQGVSFGRWAGGLPGVRLAGTFEIPYATANTKEVNSESARQFGRNLAGALRLYLVRCSATGEQQ